MEERIIELEKKISFQEHMIEELNGVVIDQQKKLDELERVLRQLYQQFESGELVKKQEEEEPPPHY